MRAASEGGFTLAEALVASGLFGVLLLVAGQLTLAASHGQRRDSEASARFREAALAADRIGRDLRSCEALYAPDPWRWGERQPLAEGASLTLVFRRSDPRFQGDRALGYGYSAGQATLEAWVYGPEFDPTRPSTWRVVDRRTLARGLAGFTLTPVEPAARHGAPFLSIGLLPAGPVGQPGGPPLLVEVRVKGL